MLVVAQGLVITAGQFPFRFELLVEILSDSRVRTICTDEDVAKVFTIGTITGEGVYVRAELFLTNRQPSILHEQASKL